MLRLYDTARGELRPVEPRQPGRLSMYVCGPTVYGEPHIGHGRFTLVWDVFRRYLRWAGWDVRYVSNITDIDDKIIARANREGRTSEEVARQFEAEWYEAMDALGVERPDADPHATGYLGEMVALVGALVDAGLAYETADGVYLSVEKVPGYGLLARQPLETLRSGARATVGEGKASPMDFALWKKAKPGEPTWDSPWGPGRPGWHTECVVMSLDLLGEDFDLHGGGDDLTFPHHENERAQAVAAGRAFARHWVHSGMVVAGGEKMARSVGNVVSLTDLVREHDPRAYRLLVLRSHYRRPIEVTPDTLADADAALERLDAFARRTADLAGEADPTVLAGFRERMEDDLDTPAAVALVFDLVRRANAALDDGDTTAAAPLAATVRELCAAVGLELRAGASEVPPEVDELVRRRQDARNERDFATADALRDRLAELGWVVEDTPGGPVPRPAPG